MTRQTTASKFLQALVLAAVFAAAAAVADDGDPPTRVARLAYLDGSVSFQPAGTQDWVAPPVNRPMTTGDQLWADRDSRAELQLDGSLLQLSANTAVSFLNLGDRITQVQLSAGTLIVRVRRLDDDETYEIDTPNLAFSVLRPGVYRLTVDPAGNTTAVAVRRGQGEATGGGNAYTVYADQYEVFSGAGALQANSQAYGPGDDFDAWSADRDNRWEHSESARYVSPDVIGYEDLDDQGNWNSTPDYGYVWFPRRVAPGWAPYHDGHWAYIAPWGYTWVDDSPWGFAPFHYGRWINERGAWGWVPAPPRPQGEVYVRPVYAPALVAWVGVGAGVAWFALGPREVYVPAYPVSRGYVNQINVSNTTVNNTVITNVYNTTIVNNKTVNVTYVNRQVPGAIMATSSQAFTSAQPVGRNRLAIDARAVAGAPVRVLAPAIVPNKQAVLGSGRVTGARPPAAVENRVVVARAAPPAAAPSFEQRQAAIRSNDGRPLSVAQVRQIAPAVTPRPAVQIAPPPKTLIVPARAASAPARPPETPRPTFNPPAPRPPATVIHANDAPQAPRPASPAVAESVLERQHLQEQQQLHAQQEAERQRIQQQQELEHQQLAKQQEAQRQQQDQSRQQAAEAQRQQAAAAARRQAEQQIEQQHQQQTQQMLQRQAQEQQQMQQRQEEQRRQQAVQPAAPKAHSPEPPNQKPPRAGNR